MFTGIIEEVGTVSRVQWGERCCRLAIDCETVLSGTKEGDSIAVNGTCLTAAKLEPRGFWADVMPETMRRTAFSRFRPGTGVNLERALPLGGRLGGHLVAGHVDGTGRIVSLARDSNAIRMTVSLPEKEMRYILEKGSVAVDGVSLTVAERDRQQFTVSLIPHTGMKTALLEKRDGDLVNIEYDMVGKYIEQFLAPPSQGITMELLAHTLGR